MIFAKEFNRDFSNKEELFDFLRKNKNDIIATKKMQFKEADPLLFNNIPEKIKSSNISKAIETQNNNLDELKVKIVINTTNIMDSHSDVHIPGLWKKTLKENKNIYLVQEHKMMFDKIIAENVKAYTQSYRFNELGYDSNMTTEALIFDADVLKERNDFMFKQYVKGWVKNHSVGMMYVKIFLAINSNSKYDIEEKEVWDKYIDEIVNKEEVINQGYFWAVTEAKLIEGSAVPIGSNKITPTISVSEKADNVTFSNLNNEPIKFTQNKTNINNFI